jgi:hypothetical protein
MNSLNVALDVHSRVRPYRLPVRVSRFGLPLPGTGPVPPSRFLTALTGFSVVRAAGLLHPAADPGVHRVRSFDLASRPGERSSTVRDPSKVFPRQQLPALTGILPPHRSPSKDGAISGSCSAGRVRCIHRVLPLGGARSSHGFFLVHLSSVSPSRAERGPEGPRLCSRGPLRSGSEVLGSPRRLQGLRSSSRSHHPGDWVGSAVRSVGGDYGLTQARGGFEWRVPGGGSLSVPRGAERSDRLLDPLPLRVPMMKPGPLEVGGSF